MKKLKIAAILSACLLVCGCSVSVQANTIPANAYISTEKESETAEITAKVTEGVTAEAVTKETTVTTTTVATTTTPDTTATKKTPEETTTMPLPVYTNTITLLGPNMVYTGESFDYKYDISHRNAERASILWKCDGDSASLSTDGKLLALKKGTVTLTVSDVSNGLTDTLTVHIVDTPEDVDFVPEVNGIPIANKTYPVPPDYNPGLLSETYNAFLDLKQAALDEGLDITFMSGFRSYGEQYEVYKGWNEVYASEADRISARPGHSEHQLGLAIDVNSIEFSFAETPEGLWLAENCYKFGFIIRYKEGTELITGYMYEPWHIRYLGKETAEKVHFSGLTLEEYLGIDSYYRIEEYVFDDEEEIAE